jgi:hypothetical protein
MANETKMAETGDALAVLRAMRAVRERMALESGDKDEELVPQTRGDGGEK